jgi:hypothetical protein
MGDYSAFASLGIFALLACCGGLLLSIFLFGPLPYLISAAVLKIENRGYWKAFGTFILGWLASSIISAIIGVIFSAVTGGFGSYSLSNPNDIYPFLMNLLNRAWLVGLISFVVSILVQVAITAGLYRVSFGKGFLICLLALVFAILISVVLGLLAFVLSLAGILPSLKDLGNLPNFQNLIPGLTY